MIPKPLPTARPDRPGLEPPAVADLARQLQDAERTATALPALAGAYPDLTLADAYAVQLAYVAARTAAGARVVGHKVGCTNPVVQALFGIDRPDYGQLLDDMVLPDGAPIARERLIQPRIEPEIAFVLRDPLEGPGVTSAQVLRATQGVLPCFEIVDSRVQDWQIRFVDTVADNGSSARCVLGCAPVPAAGLDLRLLGVVLEKNGEVVATGAGAAALGHPAAAVAWLANTLAEQGGRLEAGQLVLPGALTTAPAAEAGDTFRASFAGLGSVTCTFT